MSDAAVYLQIAVWSQIVSSIVFVAVLVFMWYRWVLPVVMGAQERSNRQIAEAERHRDEVKGALDALNAEIDTARHDAELIERRAKARAEHERQLLLNESTEAGERLLGDAGRELERARAAARHELRDELLERALRLARDRAAAQAGPEIDRRFVDALTDSLDAARA